MIRKVTAAILAASMVFSLAACGGGAGSSESSTATAQPSAAAGQDTQAAGDGEQVTLTFWMEMATPELNEKYQAAADAYMELNPNVKIEYLGIPGNAIDAKNKIEMAFSANAAPDVFQSFMPEFITRGNIISLTDYYKNSKLNGKIAQGSLEANIEYDPAKKDLYAIPAYMTMRIFWVRPDYFKEKGLEVPATWDEFFDGVKTVTDPEKPVYGTTIRGGSGGAQNLEYLMYAYSGITEAFDENGKSTLNDPLHVEFAEKYLSMYNKYTAEDDLSKGWTEMAASFQSGTTASVFHNYGSAELIDSTFNGDYSKFQLMEMPPSVKGYKCHPIVDATGYSISSTCKNPDIAWDFIEFMVTGETAASYIKLRGGIPTEETAKQVDWVQDKPYYKTGVEYFADPELHFFKEPLYLTEYRNILANTAEPKMQEAMVGMCTVQEFLDEWADAFTAEKARYDAEYAAK